MTTRLKWSIVLLSVLFYYCERPTEDFNDCAKLGEILDCYENNPLSQSEFRSALRGKWELFAYGGELDCFETIPENERNTTLLIKSNSQLEWRVDGILQQKVTYTLTMDNSGYWWLKTSPNIGETVGRIFICQSILLFQNSYSDAIDKYFIKI